MLRLRLMLLRRKDDEDDAARLLLLLLLLLLEDDELLVVIFEDFCDKLSLGLVSEAAFSSSPAISELFASSKLRPPSTVSRFDCSTRLRGVFVTSLSSDELRGAGAACPRSS